MPDSPCVHQRNTGQCVCVWGGFTYNTNTGLTGAIIKRKDHRDTYVRPLGTRGSVGPPLARLALE